MTEDEKTFVKKMAILTIKADTARSEDKPRHRIPGPQFFIETAVCTYADLSSEECVRLAKWMREWKIAPRSLFAVEELRHIEEMIGMLNTNQFTY